MRKHQIFKVSLLFVMALIELPILAQGVIVFKKDGTQVKYPYEVIDSIVTYKYDESIKDDVTKHVAQAIDLGLSVKWASHNVGAAVPEEYGSYYSAGEIKEKNSYGIKDYLYYVDNEYIEIGSNISGTEYDVAHVYWEDGWRIPTMEEIKELLERCTFEWVEYNGVLGDKVTGPNGNSIFLPAAGYRYSDTFDTCGVFGYYLSSELTAEGYNRGVNYLYFSKDGQDWVNGNRFYGHTIRPVKK